MSILVHLIHLITHKHESPRQPAAPAPAVPQGCGLDNLMASIQRTNSSSSVASSTGATAGGSTSSRANSPPPPSHLGVEVTAAVATTTIAQEEAPAVEQEPAPTPAPAPAELEAPTMAFKPPPASKVAVLAPTGSILAVEPSAASGAGLFKAPPRKAVGGKSLGARKLGARRMGAVPLGAAGGNDGGMASFDETAKQAAAAQEAAAQATKDKAAAEEARREQERQMFAPSSASAKPFESPRSSKPDWGAPLPQSPAVADAMRGLNISSSSPATEPAAASSSLASSARFANAKGIGSDQLFGRDDEDPDARYQRQQKLAALGGARGISSNMYFDNGSGDGGGLGSSNSGYDVDSPSLQEAAEVAAERARQLGQSVARGVGFLKNAGADLLDSFRG